MLYKSSIECSIESSIELFDRMLRRMSHRRFGDAVGESNKTLLMQLAREDGMLLKPDRPATAIDAQFHAMLFDVWPGQPDGPSPGHGRLLVAACDGSNPMQRFSYSGTTSAPGVFKIASIDGSAGCIDVSGCDDRAGAGVSVYNNTLGGCGTRGDCGGRNELWTLAANDDGPSGHERQYSIRSSLSGRDGAASLCLELSSSGARLQVRNSRSAPQIDCSIECPVECPIE